MRPRAGLAVLTLVALVASGLCCTGGGREAAPAKVRVALMPFLSYAPLILAKETGDFEAQGLDVEFVRMKGSIGAVPLLLRSDLDVLPGYLNPGLFNAVARGGGIRLVADLGRFRSTGCTHIAIAVHEDLLREGRPDPGGRDLSLSVDVGMVSELLAERALERAGVPLDRVRTVSIPNEAELAALEQGSVDLAVMSSPWLPLPPETRRVQLWVRELDVLPGFQSGVLVYGPRLIEREPEVGKRFMVGYLAGVRRYNRGKTRENLTILAHATGLEPSRLQQTCWPVIGTSGRVDGRSVQLYQEWAARKGYLDRVLPEGRWWDPRFVDHASQGTETAGVEAGP